MRTQALLGCLVVLLFGLGCSGDGLKRAAVSGKILVDKTPLQEGAITFFPTEGTQGPSVGAVIENGAYHIPRDKGVIVGKNRVEIRGFRKTGKRVSDPMEPGKLIDEIVPALAPQYHSQSTLIREIKEGTNTLDFDLPGTKGK